MVYTPSKPCGTLKNTRIMEVEIHDFNHKAVEMKYIKEMFIIQYKDYRMHHNNDIKATKGAAKRSSAFIYLISWSRCSK